MSSTHREKGTYRDFYPTPRYSIEPLVRAMNWPDRPRILEPCKGTGIIIDVVTEMVPGAEFDWCEITEGRDFFAYEAPAEKFDLIITNPPFSQAQAFIDKSLTLAHCVIMLLPLNYLGTQVRRDWWREVHACYGDLYFYVLSRRPRFVNNGSDSNEYAWFVLDLGTGRVLQDRENKWLL